MDRARGRLESALRLCRAAWLEPWTARQIWLFWLVSRLLLITLAIAVKVLGAQHGVLGDVRLYDRWGGDLVHGWGLPVTDERWQYPPAAAVVLAIPSALEAVTRFPYGVGFFLMILASDAAITAIVARRSVSAARFWLIGICALGPVTMARFDMVPALLTVAAVAALSGPSGGGRGNWGRAGLAVGLGTAVKVWPVLLLLALGAPGSGRRLARLSPHPALLRLVAGMAGAAALVTGVLFAAGWWRDAFGFLDAQKARGLQVEAVAATPFVLAHMVGLHAGPVYAWGALQFGSDAAQLVATACSFVEVVVVLAAVARWWLPRPSRGREEARMASDPADRMLALLLVVLVTSRVLSPQYLVWVLAVAACRPLLSGQAVSAGHHVGDPRRRVTAGLLATCLLSFVVYPVRYEDVIQGRVVASLLLVARNGLLLIVCWYAVRAAWPLPWREVRRSWWWTRPAPRRPAPCVQADVPGPAGPRSEPARRAMSDRGSPI